MKKIVLFTIVILCAQICVAQNVANDSSLVESYISLQQQQIRLENDVLRLNREAKVASSRLMTLSEDNKALHLQIDSLQEECRNLNDKQISNKNEMNEKVKQTTETLLTHQSTLKNRTVWGGCIAGALVIILAFVSYYLLRRIKKGNKSIDEISKVQDALQEVQKKLQEESVQLDNKLLELMEKQISIVPVQAPSSPEIDHSLALKVADEIVRIETNLLRMDASIKGYKQLTKAVDRIKDNFKANGYEIVDMLGKPYNEGMKVTANFAIDETLSEGEQKITGIIKPQVNYNGKMIQAAQITVSQNI